MDIFSWALGIPWYVLLAVASGTMVPIFAFLWEYGFSELQAATGRQGLRLVRIDGQEATPENVTQERYPFWQTEYAYTFGEPRADSLTAGFLRYLTNEVGQEIVRTHGHRPCSELLNPTLCSPSEEEPAPALSPRPTL
ncbi:MAG: hypothetical protein ACRDOO_05600 [Actinomadura sp.]